MQGLKYLILMLVIACCVACIDDLNVPIRVEKPKLVIDGLITNEKTNYQVKLSFTGKYSNSNYTPPSLAVNGAKVEIIDIRGRSVELFQDVLELGTYRTIDSSFVGQIGHSYKLSITLSTGEKYSTAATPMVAVPNIFGLSFEFKDIDNQFRPDGYQIYLDTKDPSNETNYYRWSAYGFSRWESTGAKCSAFGQAICYDFCWVPTTYNQVKIASDANINGNFLSHIPVFYSPVAALGTHLIEVSQYSLSKAEYTFWKLYEEQRQRTGTIFDPQPAAIEGNLINEADPSDIALGYFGVSAVSRRKTLVPYDGSLKYSTIFLKQGDCRKAFANGTIERPIGWESFYK
jgi:Domain of unknown function (DUF4249)